MWLGVGKLRVLLASSSFLSHLHTVSGSVSFVINILSMKSIISDKLDTKINIGSVTGGSAGIGYV